MAASKIKMLSRSSSSSSSLSILLMLLSFLLLTTLSSSSSIVGVVGFGREGRKVGGRMEVKDVKSNKEVQKLGKFSVEEFNRNLERDRRQEGLLSAGDEEFLKFSEVVEAQRQVVSGIKYYLKISAEKSSGEEKKFDAVVWVKLWMRSKKLINFAPSTN
ncbi:Proteinase inhibitor I25 [Macleaya cordata]|uniref:Proteinase inhibitor I25 n=1 Tax=Macleaya cordata TaxID=56857 RepID=A0A200PTV8_MACCD|nr:Proteinase inhibitor I25 [Macleaya cordata]